MKKNSNLCIPLSEAGFAAYRKDLAELANRQRLCRQMYVAEIEHILAESLQKYKLDDLFDPFTGGVTFYDDEWELIDESDLIKNLFEELDREGCYKYILQLDGKILLRGAEIYYFFSCYLSRFRNPCHKQIRIWFENVESFLQRLLVATSRYKSGNKVFRRLMLGVLDNIRNIVLILATSELLCSCSGQTAVLEASDTVWSCHIKLCHKLMYKLCFYEVENTEFLGDVESLVKAILDDIPSVRNTLLKVEDGYLLLKCVNPWREADNYMENIVGMRYVADKLKDNRKPLHLYGLLCGGLELPYILEMFLQSKVFLSFLYQRTGLYMEKTSAFHNILTDKLSEGSDERIVNIIVDENALSGISAQLAVQ